MIGAWSRSGSTGEHLPRRSAAAGAPVLAVPRVRAGRSCSRSARYRATVLPPDHERHRIRAISNRQRTVDEPIPAPRGYIYDRNGRLLVKNVPTFAVKIRPADLPDDDARSRSSPASAALLRMDPAEINATIDGNPGSAFDLVRIAQDVDRQTAQLISEAGFELPGVDVAVEARRQYTDGAADVPAPRLHRPGLRRAASRSP